MKGFWRGIVGGFLLLCSMGFLGLLGVFGLVAFLLKNYAGDIPDFSKLQNYQPPLVTRVYTGDGRLMAEFAEERRVFVPIASIPKRVQEAFISAEDQNFYKHEGLDFTGIGRAILINLRNIGSDNRLVGASTITQQVAKNMLLTNEVSFARKFKEAILALRMERVMSKDHLLELYLNQIYLGRGAYGVAAAAQTYFNKGLDELTVEEAAYLGALPKAPNNYDPDRRHGEALTRRNWVIGRMEDDGYITGDEAKMAQMQPLSTVSRDARAEAVRAPYFAEEIRRFLAEQRGSMSLYTDGLLVRSTLDPHLQDIAERAFRYGVTRYDHRHGWRGPIARFDNIAGWATRLQDVPMQKGMLPDWHIAVVTKKSGGQITLGIAGGEEHPLSADDVKWAGDLMHVGDIVMAGPESYLDRDVIADIPELDDSGHVMANPEKPYDAKFWHLRQVPAVQGGLVAIDPYTGRVLAMQGGWDYERSEFNRATQAQRQVGSAFKPFEYIAALEDGYTPSTRILDAPISFSMGHGQGVWSPGNYEEGEYGGPTTIRVCIEKSRNLPTVRLAAHLGMDRIAQTVERFGVYDPMEKYLANALGAQETTLLKLATGYAMIANGGQRITPTFIDRIQNREGKTVYARDSRACADCGPRIAWAPGEPVPEVKKDEDLVTDPRVAYQMVNILEGVPKRGTAQMALKNLDWPIAGKTGTTNDERDAWFMGFTPDIVVGMYVGFDTPKPLGRHETGGMVAAPMFRAFMNEYIKGREPVPFRIPPGISLVEVNAATGQRTSPDDPKAIMEAFLSDREPEGDDSGYEPAPYAASPDDAGGAYNAPAGAGETGGTVQAPPPPAAGAGALRGTGGIY
ncbi:MAG: penicillin-binding protein 1A [Rhodospirillales bacterium]|nr:penicillin-binding protein 1A [Alphaproteobacteria bacterium]MCB9986458.1 penicillin-binding protein 1A [Rhodospirillales bacterium]USO06996.1 MAG: penicillin-binding protein 1A [Rhodospirillales bacterium]